MAVGFTTTYNGRVAEVDDLLVKREFFNDGTLWTWGRNTGGEIGTGDTTSRSSPGTTAGAGINWIAIANGNRSSAGVKSDGTLWTWGLNATGELGTGNLTSRSSPGTTAGGGTNWKQISIGIDSTVQFMGAVKTDGTLWTWGANDFGQLGTNDTTPRSSPVTTAVGGSNWAQVSCGGNRFAAAVKTDGTLWTWGLNSSGVLGTGNTTNRSSPGQTSGAGTNWKQVSVGYQHMAAIKTDGTLWTWGANASISVGALGDDTTTARSSPGQTAGGGTNWKEVSAKFGTFAIKTDGTLWTWGYNATAQLGDGTTTSRSSPGTTAGGGTDWKTLAQGHAGGSWMGAIKTNGTLYTWGSNNTGRTGRGTDFGNTTSPATVVGNITNWKSIATGEEHGSGITDLTI